MLVLAVVPFDGRFGKADGRVAFGWRSLHTD